MSVAQALYLSPRVSVFTVLRAVLTATKTLDATRAELVASVLAGLVAYHHSIVVRIIDAICERIIASLQVGEGRRHHRLRGHLVPLTID